MTLAPTKIAVLLGGPSAEHEVSLVSGRAIASACIERGHDVEGWLIDRQSRWWSLPRAALDPALPVLEFSDPSGLDAAGPLSAAAALQAMVEASPPPVVFPAMHGPFGEDGAVQALLESVGLTYCGSGPAASALGMNKSIFKRLCAAMELPVLPWMEATWRDFERDAGSLLAGLASFAGELPDPRLIVKPARLGSSIGISIVQRPAAGTELRDAVELALRYDDLAIVEPYLDHPRELEISVLGNDRSDTVAFGPGEVMPGREFYDYVAKYESDDSVTTPTAELPAQVAADARAAAIEVYLAIGASGFARVDLLQSRDEVLFISEINTIPGFTPISLFPRMTATGGYDFAATCERIVELALQRQRDRPTWRLGATERP